VLSFSFHSSSPSFFHALQSLAPLIHRLSAWDGLPLVVQEWHGGDRFRPLLCLPGLVRTGGDFAPVAAALGAGRRVIAPDYAGRGDSGRARDVDRYAPEACLRDVLDICAALHVHAAVGIGTSFGGLLCMGIAAARPSLLHAVVLNDVGPEIGGQGADFVRRFVAADLALPSLEACVAHLRAVLPPLSLHGEADWQTMARLTYAPGPDGRWHPVWDTRIAKLLQRGTPDLWPLFGALAPMNVLLVRGEASNILLPDTVARMVAARPDMAVIGLPGIGHAPTLAEPEIVAALRDFLERVE
jgi:pimeloyl-ACP methyl ester carboxylesterase